jgi:hypothetical protein
MGLAVWLNLVAALDELGSLVAVHLSPAATVARDAHGAEHALGALGQPALEALGALLDARSTPDEGPPTGTPCSRFAGAALGYEHLAEATLQIHRWPAAATWRAVLASTT